MGWHRHSFKTTRTRYCASVRIGGTTIQVNYATPRELVRALREYGQWNDGRVVVRKLYIKGRD